MFHDMASGKDIKRRIKSIKNTGKITRAMEMVSAAKMRRAIASVLQVRAYAHSAWTY
jgi:F-type H+-transporting ATPase subunit gamma